MNSSIKQKNKVLNILILGGSQGAKVFGEKLPRCFKGLDTSKIQLSIKQQVQKQQTSKINDFYKKIYNLKYHYLNLKIIYMILLLSLML